MNRKREARVGRGRDLGQRASGRDFFRLPSMLILPRARWFVNVQFGWAV